MDTLFYILSSSFFFHSETRIKITRLVSTLQVSIMYMYSNRYFRGRKIFEPPRYMSVKQAAEQLLEIVDNRRSQNVTEANIRMHYFVTLSIIYK